MRFIPLFLLGGLAAARAETPGPVVFSELMWMGSTASSADEWVELYNRSDSEVDLAGWTLTRLADDGEVPMLQIGKFKLPPGNVLLIANYSPEDSRSTLAVKPQVVDAAISLPNTKLQLRLYDGDPLAGAQLVDVADDGSGAPLAGDSQLKKAMVRVLFDADGSVATSWATAQEASGWDEGAIEQGTPGLIPPHLRSASSATPTSAQRLTWAAVKTAW